MADLDKLTDELTGKAARAAGMSVAKRALQDALLTDDEREARDGDLASAKKSRRTKTIVYAAIGLLLFIGVIGLALSYWHWFLLAGVAGAAGLYVRSRLRKRRTPRGGDAELVESETSAVEAAAARRERARSTAAQAAAQVEPEAPAPRRPTAEEAEADAEAVDAELAAMKARLRK